jgi:carbamoyl-phosphate synthase/aspartate carbamoyltransferase/dihydroorotase
MAVLQISGMIDPHVHLRGLEWAHKGTFASETAAALAGGYTAVFDMPNTPPVTTHRAALDAKLAEISAQALCDFGLYAGAAMDENWRDYPQMQADVCGLKIFNNATTGDLLIADQSVREAHYRAWDGHKTIAVHAEGQTVLDILALVRQFGKHTHFLHISTAEEIRYLQAAKEANLPITVGVCPHHLWLTQEDLPTLGAFGLMKPELKTKADRDALWDALKIGLVDVIESDHAPHTRTEKAGDKPVYGVPGLETTVPLLLTAVREGRLTVEQVTALVADNPRRIFGALERPETFTVIDPNAHYTIDNAKLHTQCGWSPFDGMTVYGKVRSVTIRGQQVYDGEHILAQPGFGQNLYG